jgi:hypothetical protein
MRVSDDAEKKRRAAEERLFKQVYLWTLGRIPDDDPDQAATRKDAAREATLRALHRYLRVKPDLTTDAERLSYVAKAARSELDLMREEEKARKRAEEAAVTDHVTTGGRGPVHGEVMMLERAADLANKKRATRLVKGLYAELDGDVVGLGQIKLILKGITDWKEQAKILRCTTQDLDAARKRRERAMKRVRAADAVEDHDDEEMDDVREVP